MGGYSSGIVVESCGGAQSIEDVSYIFYYIDYNGGRGYGLRPAGCSISPDRGEDV
jgi:hypothetical protein